MTVTASDAKNRFGPLLEEAIKGGAVVITKHREPKAVLISMAEFEALRRSGQTTLDALSGEFNEMLDRMQRPASRAAMDAAFHASPKELARLAVKHARRRG